MPSQGAPFLCVVTWRRNQHSPVEVCREPAEWGTPYCTRHGGQARPRAVKARDKAAKGVQGKALAILQAEGIDVGRIEILDRKRSVDPGVLLLEEVSRCAGIIQWLEDKISSLQEDGEFIEEVENRITEVKEGTGSTGESYTLARTEVRKEVSHWWKLLQEERKLLTQATTAALRSNIEERRVRLAERGVDALEAAMAAALLDLGLDPHNERVRAIVGHRMREALEGGQAFFSGTETQVVPERIPIPAERIRDVETPPGDHPQPVSF